MTPALVEEGHHSRQLRHLTGLEVQENQARRLLNDIATFGAHLARVKGEAVPQAVVAARWVAEVYEPIVEMIPLALRGRLEPAELFHQLLEHRYYLSEAAGHEVDNETALWSYLESVLRFRPDERVHVRRRGVDRSCPFGLHPNDAAASHTQSKAGPLGQAETVRPGVSTRTIPQQ